MADEAKKYVELGFTNMKMKVGGASHEEDVARVASARQGLGKDGLLMIDALGNMSVGQALKFAEATKKYDIYWFEQPVNFEDFEGMKEVNERAIAVAGNENMSNHQMFKYMMEKKAVRFVQPDILVTGGITGTRKICSMAESHHLAVTLHNSSSAVGMAASLHLAAGVENVESVEFHQLHDYLFDRAPEGTFKVIDGHVRMTDRPGLGLDFTPDDFPE